MKYSLYRIKTGDSFGFSGRSLQARAIQKFQQLDDIHSGHVNHTGTFIWINKELYICEATEWKDNKIRALVLLTPFQQYVDELEKYEILYHFKYKGEIDQEKMNRVIISTIGIPYDYKNLLIAQPVRTLTSWLRGKGKGGLWIGRKDNTSNRTICHENNMLIWNMYNGLFPEHYKGRITDLYYNESFEKNIIIHK